MTASAVIKEATFWRNYYRAKAKTLRSRGDIWIQFEAKADTYHDVIQALRGNTNTVNRGKK